MNTKARFLVTFLTSIILSIIVVYISLTNGTFDIRALDALKTIIGMSTTDEYELVIFEFRLPRIIIGLLVGFALGIAGAALQGITRNHLADPGILGIQSAAGMMIVLFMFFIRGTIKGAGLLSVLNMTVFGWAGGILAAGLLFLFSRNNGSIDPKRLILVGIALNAGFGALTLYISLKMNPQDFEMATVWLSGSIYSASWAQIIAMLPWVIILVPVLIFKAHSLNVLQLDEITVTGIGLHKERERSIILLCCAGLISASVAVSGSIAFVGLIAPHIARKLIGVNHIYIIPISGTIGMLMVMLGDLIGKTVFAPAELSVGIVISIIGVPYFIYLLIRGRK